MWGFSWSCPSSGGPCSPSVALKDGTEFDILPGQAYVVEPGHNLWVVGDEPVIAYEFYQDSN